MTYVGRFAPSPSGPLHKGSLLAALGSALDALHHRGRWLIRLDDLDPQRSKAAFDSVILQQLQAHGLRSPWPIIRQSARFERYRDAFERLQAQGLVFACDCSRKQRRSQADPCCERDCRHTQRDPASSAWRADLRGLAGASITDRSLGNFFFDPARYRDVIIWRRDGIAAYHLAVVVDDAEQGVTDVVRGADLADSLPWQYALQRLLNLPEPRYLHLPLLTDADGRKLSKSQHAAPLDPQDASAALLTVLAALRQDPPPKPMDPEALLAWAAEHWQPARFAGLTRLTVR